MLEKFISYNVEKINFQTMLKLNVALILTISSLSSARLVETGLGPVMGERWVTASQVFQQM